jgi:hypothetical protein
LEAAFNLFLWGLAGALVLVVPGALFGGAAQCAAFCREESASRTLGTAILRGVLQGGLFIGGFGLLAGMVIGGQAASFAEGARGLGLLACGTSLLMAGAAVMGGMGYYWTWLGQRFLGLLLSIVISGSLLAIVAWKFGLPRQTAALGALAMALLTAAGVTIARLLSPREVRPSPAEVAEELWLDWQTVRREDSREQPPTDDRFHS